MHEIWLLKRPGKRLKDDVHDAQISLARRHCLYSFTGPSCRAARPRCSLASGLPVADSRALRRYVRQFRALSRRDSSRSTAGSFRATEIDSIR